MVRKWRNLIAVIFCYEMQELSSLQKNEIETHWILRGWQSNNVACNVITFSLKVLLFFFRVKHNKLLHFSHSVLEEQAN